jgi:hypothetical protein
MGSPANLAGAPFLEVDKCNALTVDNSCVWQPVLSRYRPSPGSQWRKRIRHGPSESSNRLQRAAQPTSQLG